MAKVTIFSLDYDGCSDVLFDELIKSYEHAGASVQAGLMAMRAKLNTFLEREASFSEKPVELYVGSNRQSHALDELNSMKHGINNGRCFTNFPALCEAKHWLFRPLLLADVDNHKPAGTALTDPSLNCHFDEKKIQTIENQVMDAVKNHPDDEVHFYFLDDDAKKTIFRGLATYFASEENAVKIPANIHLHFVKFDWFGELQEHEPSLIDIAHIQGRKPVEEPTLLPSSRDDSVYRSGLTVFGAPREKPLTTSVLSEEVRLVSRI